MLHLDHLVLEQPGFRLAANWTVQPGERIAVLGPSGGGKSSLLLAIAGFFAPVSGRIRWQGQDITPLPPAQRPVSILFQDQNLFPHLTIAQNLGLAIAPNLRLTSDDKKRIDSVLTRLGLSGLGPRKPADLSGGQQGRAALGRALLQARPILLLDEPFAALGPALKADLLVLVAEVAGESGASVLLVTHDPQDARRFAPRTVLVAEGLAQPPQDTASLFANPPKALQDYLGA